MIPTDLTPSILQGHALDVPRSLPAEPVQCVVTSPPHWGWRRYDVCGCAQDYVREEGVKNPLPRKAAGGKGILVRRGKGDKPRRLYRSTETWAAVESYVRTHRILSDRSALFTARRGDPFPTG